VKPSKGRVWTGVIRVGPADRDHLIAMRAAVSVAVPLLTLFAFDRLDLAVYASFGAFAALYGRHDLAGDRIRMQASAGVVLVLAMLIGTTLSALAAPTAIAITVVALIAAMVTLLAYAMRWHPPGALFVVFAAGATAGIPATFTTLPLVLLVGGSSVLFALVVSVVLALISRARPLPRPAPQRVGSVAWEMALTVLAATLIAGFAGALILGTHWYWAMVGAVAAVSGASVSARVIRGLQRLLGTLVGVALAAGVLSLHLPPLAVIAIAVVLQATAELFIGRNYGIAMVFITPLALLMIELAASTPIELLLRDRTIETVIGVAAGTAVAVASAALRRRRRSDA